MALVLKLLITTPRGLVHKTPVCGLATIILPFKHEKSSFKTLTMSCPASLPLYNISLLPIAFSLWNAKI